MAAAYSTPELYNIYCSGYCPIGKDTVPLLNITEFDRIALQIIGAMQHVEELTLKLVAVAEDGKAGDDEVDKFESVIKNLENMSKGALSLKLWAKKNLKPTPKAKR